MVPRARVHRYWTWNISISIMNELNESIIRVVSALRQHTSCRQVTSRAASEFASPLASCKAVSKAVLKRSEFFNSIFLTDVRFDLCCVLCTIEKVNHKRIAWSWDETILISSTGHYIILNLDLNLNCPNPPEIMLNGKKNTHRHQQSRITNHNIW